MRETMLSRDGYVIIAARGLRMFAYGCLSVVLALYLSAAGFSVIQIGVLFTVALAGGAAVTAVVSLRADRWGRRMTLVVSAVLMAVAGAALAARPDFSLLLVLAALGTLSPGGQDVGAFQSLEQAALLETGSSRDHVMPYAWYNLVGSAALAIGALAAGAVPAVLHPAGWTSLAAQRALVWVFAATGVVSAGLYATLSRSAEGPPRQPSAPRRGL
ncbi:MAG TPA: MFS transporter, partial [bacterium]|nr:MFS transporter [bacterium]